jgi:uncharacterized coiled-coil protein SlyX
MASQEKTELSELLTLLKAHMKDEQTSLDKLSKGSKVVQAAAYLVVLLLGIGVAWGMTSSKIAAAEHTAVQVVKLEERVQDLEIHSAADAEVLKSIRSDISEIKEELKKINRTPH